jgi:hypothetical protein
MKHNQQNNSRKLPKSQDAYPGIEGLWDTRQRDQDRTILWHIIVKTISSENKERILEVIRDKSQVTYKGKPMKITADFFQQKPQKQERYAVKYSEY